jgi:predicted anti-sigma-YlaC factor YlaD
MNCISEELLWEYLDNEIDGNTKQEIETHLIICPKCKDEMEEIKFFNQEFSNAVKQQSSVQESRGKLIEIKLSYSEAKPMLRNFWKGFVMFGFFVSLITALFVAFAYPVQGTNVFETEFHLITYALSQLIYFMGTPVIMDVWMIAITFSFLFWADKVWRSRKYNV